MSCTIFHREILFPQNTPFPIGADIWWVDVDNYASGSGNSSPDDYQEWGGSKSVATAVFKLDNIPDDINGIDLVVKIYRGNSNPVLIVEEKLNYHFVVWDSVDDPVPSDLNDADPGGYVFVSGLGTGSVLDVIPIDGSAPNFWKLKPAIQDIIDAEQQTSIIKISNLTLEQCRHIALELIWSDKKNYPPEFVQIKK